jgi:hypothetical protein
MVGLFMEDGVEDVAMELQDVDRDRSIGLNILEPE